MMDCCLLLLQKGAKWIPFVAIPTVIAGGVASICLMLSGIKGIITEYHRPKRTAVRSASPERVVQWIAPGGLRRQKGRSNETLMHRNVREKGAECHY